MNYIPWDERRLTEIVKLWNSEIGLQFPMREELFKQNSFDDENIMSQGSFIAINQDDQVVGFVISKRWQSQADIPMNDNIGWIQALITHASVHGTGIGSALLQRAEAAMKECNLSKIILGRDPGHYFPGIPIEYKHTREWFERRGYRSEGLDVIESDLINHYIDETKQTMPSLENIEFSLVNPEEKGELLSFLTRCFPGRWQYEAQQYFKRGGSGREFLIAKKAGEIIGFCRVNDESSPIIGPNVYWAPLFPEELGGIGPLGIDSAHRKQGYGLAIVEAGIAILRDRKINRIVIDWTGLVDFYSQMDFTVWKQYQSYSKELISPS